MKHILPKLPLAGSSPALIIATLIAIGFVATAVAQQFLTQPSDGESSSSAGQGSASQRQGNPQTADGQQLVNEAARRLLAESSIKASVRFSVHGFNHEVTGVGTYLQLGQGPEKLLRLELKSQVGDQTATLQEICSEDDYWVRRDVPQVGTSVGRATLRPIRQAIAKASKDPNVDPIHAWILLGGLPRMMEELHRSFQFEPAEASEIEFASADGKGVDRMPVWIIRGNWKPERLAGLMNNKPVPDPAKLPAQIPSRVELVLGRADRVFPLFPYRITYLHVGSRDLQPNTQSSTTRSDASTPLATIEFYRVYHLMDIDPREFDYDPGDQEVADLTLANMQRLGLQVTR